MKTLVHFGAPEGILVNGKPHLGTDRLVPLLRNFRQHLQALGVSDIRSFLMNQMYTIRSLFLTSFLFFFSFSSSLLSILRLLLSLGRESMISS